MNITINDMAKKEKKSITIPEHSSVESLLKSIGINQVTVLIAVNGEIALPKRILKKNDEIKIIPVVSGG